MALTCAGVGAARTSTPDSYVDAKTRQIDGGRKVLFVLASPEIEAGFDHMEASPAIILFGAAGYRLGLDPINRALAEKATPRVLPLRKALTGYDFNSRFYDAMVPVVQSSSWLRGQDFERTDDASLANLERVLNAADTRQMYMVTGNWFVDHHRQAIAVELTATILVRRIPKGQHSDARFKSDYIPYRQTYRCLTYLPGDGGEPAPQRIERWAASEGARARRALDSCIGRVRTLFAENIDATEAQVSTWRHRGDRKTIERYDMLGWSVAREGDAERYLEARTGVLNYVQTLPAD